MIKTLNARQFKYLLILFAAGSTVVVGISNDSRNNAWIAIVLSTIMVLPVVLMYARIIKLNPEECIFDMATKLFGRPVGTIVNILMTWYALHLGAMVLVNFTKYIGITSLLDTPELLISIVLLLVIIYIGKSVITTFGKWATLMLPIIILMISFTIVSSLANIRLEHIFPILGNSFGPVLNDSFTDFSFPFAETVLFLCLGFSLKKGENPYKIYIYGIITSGIMILFIFLRNLTVLGTGMMTSSYFPSFTAARVIELGEFLTRIEGIVTINFIFAGITKITVCLIAVSRGISRIINVEDHKDLVIPSGLLILMLCTILYKSIFEMYDFIKVYAIYAFPFQIIIPLAIWIASEMKNKKSKKKVNNKLQVAIT